MRLADAFTPLAKGMNSEYANQNAYDAIQIHGGSGFIMEYKSQRLYRDARIFWITATGLSKEPSRSAHHAALGTRDRRRVTIAAPDPRGRDVTDSVTDPDSTPSSRPMSCPDGVVSITR